MAVYANKLQINRVPCLLVRNQTPVPSHRSEFDHDRIGSIRVPGTEVVPSNLKQLGSVRVYTTSEIEPVQIGFELRASVNGL